MRYAPRRLVFSMKVFYNASILRLLGHTRKVKPEVPLSTELGKSQELFIADAMARRDFFMS